MVSVVLDSLAGVGFSVASTDVFMAKLFYFTVKTMNFCGQTQKNDSKHVMLTSRTTSLEKLSASISWKSISSTKSHSPVRTCTKTYTETR